MSLVTMDVKMEASARHGHSSCCFDFSSFFLAPKPRTLQLKGSQVVGTSSLFLQLRAKRLKVGIQCSFLKLGISGVAFGFQGSPALHARARLQANTHAAGPYC